MNFTILHYNYRGSKHCTFKLKWPFLWLNRTVSQDALVVHVLVIEHFLLLPTIMWICTQYKSLLSGFWYFCGIMLHILSFFKPPTRRVRRHYMYVFGLSVRPYGNLLNTKSQEPLGGFLLYLAQGCTMMSRSWIDKLIRFWARSRPTSKVKGQWTWSKYAIFTSLTQNLKNLLMDFHQTWYRGAPPGVDELIRFWARSAQRQRSMNLVSICYFYLVLKRKISRTPGWIFIKLGTWMHHQEKMNWLDFGRDSPKVKGQWTWSKYMLLLPR